MISPREVFEHKTVREMAQAAWAGMGRDCRCWLSRRGGFGEIVVPPIVSWMVESALDTDGYADFPVRVWWTAPAGVDRGTCWWRWSMRWSGCIRC